MAGGGGAGGRGLWEGWGGVGWGGGCVISGLWIRTVCARVCVCVNVIVCWAGSDRLVRPCRDLSAGRIRVSGIGLRALYRTERSRGWAACLVGCHG